MQNVAKGVYIVPSDHSPPPPPPPADQDLDQDLCFHASCPLPLTSLLQSNKIPPRQKHCLYTTWGLLFEIVTQLASISALPVYSGIFESLKHYQLDGQAAEFKFQSKLAPAGYLAITGTIPQGNQKPTKGELLGPCSCKDLAGWTGNLVDEGCYQLTSVLKFGV